MDYPAALDYILSFADYERAPRSTLVFDLRRIQMLLERLGNPQEKARSIHIAGTKGKGSTAAMIASILTQAGYRTGLYTSPTSSASPKEYRLTGGLLVKVRLAEWWKSLSPKLRR